MARLYRPHVPLEVKLRVALRQLDFASATEEMLRLHRGRLAKLLEKVLADLAGKLGCGVEDLRLDHDPPLALRPRVRRGLGRKTHYLPDANDPKHLKYRPHGAQFDGSHDVKTRIRGERGQYSDVALIKRARRREREPTPYQKRIADLKERQRAIRKEMRRALARKAGKKPKIRWKSRPLGGKKSPRRFGGR